MPSQPQTKVVLADQQRPDSSCIMFLCPVLCCAVLADEDGLLSPAEVLQCSRQLLEETQRREVDEDAAGICSLLFEHVDADKSGTVELRGTLDG